MNKESIPEEGVTIHNAGLVILQSYFPILFDRLGIVERREFISYEKQLEAVHYLQYIVTGQTKTEEHFLVLNKILCGLDVTTPIKGGIEITSEEEQLIDGMIQSVISIWSAIGSSTVNGFRGNWLVREGILRETEDRWELIVEKRPYDVLMMQYPLSFSIIKMPWMSKPIHVTCPY